MAGFLPKRIPQPVLADGSFVAGTTATLSDFAVGYDYAIDGLPFCASTQLGPNNPFVRKSIDVSKQRNDNSPEPGEQTFSAWWTLAQSSFHSGGGMKYRDVTVTGYERLRFQTSKGVDVWTPGEVELLPAAPVVFTATEPILVTGINGSAANCLLVADGAVLKLIVETVAPDGDGVLQPTYVSPVTVNWAGSGNILALVCDGRNYYAAGADGIYKGSLDTPASAAVKIYVLPGGTPKVLLGFVKQRLVLGLTTASAAKIYQLDANATVGTALPATAIYTHPVASWVWNSVTEGPAAIYVGGYAGQESAVYSLVLTSAGEMPVLTQGMTAFNLPSGEIVQGLLGYMGQVLAVSTTSGLRIGQFSGSSDPSVSLGPLSLDNRKAGTTYGPMAGYGTYIYVGYLDDDGHAGLARVDVSQPLTTRAYSYTPELIFASAPDLRGQNVDPETFFGGKVLGVARLADRMSFAVEGHGVCVAHPSTLVQQGSLLTSRLRFGTLELKQPRFLRMRVDDSFGQVAAAIGQNTDTPGATLVTLKPQVKQDTGDVPIGLDPASFLSLTFTLFRDATNVYQGPTFVGYQLKALPAVRKQREIRIPLNLYNEERSHAGVVLNNVGGALARLLELEALENTGRIVNFQILSSDAQQSLVEQVTVEDVQFAQEAGPFPGSTVGGQLVVTLRTAS